MKLILLLISSNLLLHSSEAAIQPLTEGWTLINHNESIQLRDISVPSGVYSDLEDAKVVESVLFSYDDTKLRWIAYENWTYSLNFTMTKEDLNHEFVVLTFHGLDTLATVKLNDIELGDTNNMFVRYRFDVKSHLVEGDNQLSVHFTSPVSAAKAINAKMDRAIPPDCPPEMYNGECHMNLLRKMQASFAWDWGLAAPSMGIWKNVDIEFYDSIVIRDITYQLIDEGNAWRLNILAYIETGLEETKLSGVMTSELVNVQDSLTYHNVNITADQAGQFTAELTMKVDKKSVKLWWPNGYGHQSLYGLELKWQDRRVNEVGHRSRAYYVASKTINIGFRTIELVQKPMNHGLSFFFEVNGVAMFMKGSNWIPAHILPEKTASKEKVKELLSATRDAHMNMLRVWGGGVYESDYFYSLADEYGILIWQDMMFACAMYPSDKDFLDSVRLEVRDQVRRIQYHPSIALFATNNENEVALRQNWYKTNSKFLEFADDYRKLYVETVIDEIKKNDPTSVMLTSSPSNGAYMDTDNGIGVDPQNPHYGDIHFYIVDHNAWKPENFHQPRFTSEYGFQSFPGGWKAVMQEGDNLTNLVDHRQHHPLKSKPISFLVEENLNLKFDDLSWSDKIYLSQLSQAIAMKTETEVYRSGRGSFMNTMGALYWQLNDVWVAPSWSSIEYNGNFKILHHWIKQIFAPQALITQMTLLKKLQIVAISDEIGVEDKPVTVRMHVRRFDDFRVIKSVDWKATLKANDATLVDEFDILDYMIHNKLDVNETLAEFYLLDGTHVADSFEDRVERILSSTFIFPAESFKHLKSVKDPKPDLRISSNKCEKNLHAITLEVKIEAPALFMSITLNHAELDKYQVSKNGFMQFEPIQTLHVSFVNEDCQQTVTESNFAVKTLNRFLI